MEAFVKLWRYLTTSRYTMHLEDENAFLRTRVAMLEDLWLPKVAIGGGTAYPKGTQPKHRITKGDHQACCLCSWTSGVIGDPATLQEAIQTHYRETMQVLKPGRKGLTQLIRELESEPEGERISNAS
jgi:hypothetical protein